MNLDDDSLVSGYLDGELDPEQRARVESALSASPELAAALAEIAAVRGAVSGLSRPLAPRDVTANVLARVSRDPLVRLRGAVRVRPRLGWAGLAAAAAAALLLVVRPPDLGRRPAPVGLPVERGAGEVERPAVAALEPSAPSVAPVSGVEPKVASVPAAVAVAAVSSEKDADRDGDRVRALLERPGVQRLVVMVDEITPEALRSVEDALEATPRIEPLQGRLRIGQGIVLDPSRPGEAVVYTVVLDENELTNLQAQLARRLKPGQIATAVEPADPGLVTQLADVGTIQAREGRAAAPGLFEPPPLSGTALAHNPGPPDLTPRERLAAESKSDPAAIREGSPSRVPDAPVTFPRRVTLVWVTTRTAGGHEPDSNANPG